MKNRISSCKTYFILICFILIGKQNFCQTSSNNNHKQITFKVDAVKPATKFLSEYDLSQSLAKKLKRKVKFIPTKYRNAKIVSSQFNAFVETIQNCYNDHRPLILTPDAVWLCITQGLSIHINHNFDKYKNILFNDTTNNKLELLIREDSLVSKKDYWTKAIHRMSELANVQITNTYHNLFVHHFSTSDSIIKVVQEITMLDAFKQKFIYTFESGCGIPKITIKGTSEDWIWIYNNIDQLNNLDLKEWTDELKPLIEQFVKATQGKIDLAFWKDIYKNSEEYNAHYISGWMIKLFPYLEDTENINWDDTTRHHSMDDPIKIIYKRNPYIYKNDYLKSTLSTDDFPSGIANIKTTWNNYYKNKTTDLELFGGFLGIKQYKDKSLEPFICWALTNYSTEYTKPKHKSFIGMSHDKEYWSPNFAKNITDSAVLVNKKYKTTSKSIAYIKNVITKKIEFDKQFTDTSYKGKAVVIEILSNGTVGSVYTLDTLTYQSLDYFTEVCHYSNNLSTYIKSILNSIDEKWYPALAHPVDVLEILDAPAKLTKIKVKVNSFIKIIL